MCRLCAALVKLPRSIAIWLLFRSPKYLEWLRLLREIGRMDVRQSTVWSMYLAGWCFVGQQLQFVLCRATSKLFLGPLNPPQWSASTLAVVRGSML